MRKIYSSLLVLLLMMVSTTVKAQFKIEAEAYPADAWGQEISQSLKLSEFATALGTDAATFAAEYAKGDPANLDASAVKVALDEGEGVMNTNYTQGGFGNFWMTAEGKALAWGGEGLIFYNITSCDVDNDAFVFMLGQMPQLAKVGDKLVAKIAYTYGDKTATVDITVNIVEAPPAALEVETTKLSELTIVKDYTMTLDFEEGKSYEGNVVTTSLEGIYDALGVANAADLDGFIKETSVGIYLQPISTENDVTTVLDELIPSRSTTDGWIGRYTSYDEATATETPLEMNYPLSWGANCTFYIQEAKLAEGEFSIKTGQYPGTMKGGDTDWTYLYIIVGKNAARIKVQANVAAGEPQPEPEPGEVVPFGEWQKVGEETIEAIGKGAPESGKFTVDIDAIAELLGCNANSILFNALADESNISDEHTANKGGMWMTKDGYVVKWSGNETVRAVYAEPTTEGDLSSIDYGFEAGNWAIGDESNIKLYYNFSGKYYLVTIHVKVEEENQFDLNEKAKDYLVKEFIANADGYWPDAVTTKLDMEFVQSMLGTTNFKLYTDQNVVPEGAETGELQMSKNYTCTPYPGFWYGTTTYTTADGMTVVDNAGWGNNSVGFTYADGQLTWYCPGHEAGTNYMLNVYLVNEETGDYVRYIVTTSFVEELTPETEVALDEQVKAAVEEEKIVNGFYDIQIDKAKVAEALGITEDLLSGVEIKYAKTPVTYETVAFIDEVYFNPAGYYDLENGIAASISEDWTLSVNLEDVTLSDEGVYKFRYAFDYEGKRVLYTVTLGTDTAVGISNVAAPKAADGAYYTLTGVKVAQPTEKGIYIKGGKKVFVK